MSPALRAGALVAVLSAWIGGPRRAEAFPAQPVVDSFWSSSMPWIEIPDRGNGTMQVLVNLDAPDCSDPVTSRNTAPASGMCPSAPARDVIVHVFAEGVGAPNELHAWRCQSAMCNESITLPATATQRIAVMVHGGPTAVGRQHGTLSWANGTSTGLSALSLAGNVMVDVSDPPTSNYDAETVLMPDLGNLPNDDLGADTTEVWMLRADLRVIRADVEGSGVGDAGRIALAATPPAGSTEIPRWVVARPATPLPFQLRGEATYIPTAWPGPALDPSALHNAGRMRLILNARYGTDDADYDGLSNAVEQMLGTCDGLNPFPTSASTSVRCTLWSSFTAATNPTQFMDPRDTDGDGLSDAAEVLGSDHAYARNVDTLGVGLSTVGVNTGVGETFPRWGFSPLHKDILVEIDIGIEGLSCSTNQPREGCYVDPISNMPVAIPQRRRASDSAIWPLENWMNSLRVWHDRFAVLPATRANNPDGVDGINVHFDVRATSVATNGHGMRAAFNPFPSSDGALARPGLIIYVPGNEQSGSACSCGSLMTGPSPRHGGYASLATLTPSGGGQSAPGRYIVGGLEGGDVSAHEHGHYLSLAHGGPNRLGGANPFAARAINGSGRAARIDHDLDRVAKVVHDSLMSYQFNPRQPFSLGARALTPLPRAAGGVFGYPENNTFGGANTYSVNFWRSPQSRPQRQNCSGPSNQTCIDADFDLDGVASGVAATALTEAAGHWRGGAYSRVAVQDYWCSAEGFVQQQGFCCSSSLRTNATDTFCADNSTPAQPPAAATWLLNGQPAGFVGENRAYAVFVDDDLGNYGSGGPELRARTIFNSTRTSGILRWAALDGFARSGEQVPTDCLSAQGCPGAATGPVVGTVKVDNLPVAITGTTGIAAATYRADVDLRRVTVLGWTARNTRVCSPQTACDAAWGAPRFAIARSSTLENGFASFTLPGSAPQKFAASSVTIAAWDPTMGGLDRGFTILLRGTVDPYPVRWYTCWSVSEAPNSITCADQGDLWEYDGTTFQTVTSRGSIAAAVDHPISGEPSLYLVRTRLNQDENPDRDQLAISRLRIMPGYVWIDGPINPTQSNVDFPADHIPSIQDGSISMTITPTSGLEAPDRGGRMLISWEYESGSWMNISTSGSARLASRFGVPRTGFTGFLFDGIDNNGPPSRTPLVLNPASNGIAWSASPGHVDALFFDDRPGASVRGADALLDPIVVRRARGFHVDMEAGKVVAEFFGVEEPFGHLLPKLNYDETQTLAYYTCQRTGWNQLGGMSNQPALHPLSRGWDVYRNALLLGVPAIPLRCPAASVWAVNNAALSNTLGTIDPGAINGEALSPEMVQTVVDFIERPNVFVSSADSPLTPATPPAIYSNTYCYAENPSAVYAGGHPPVTPP